MTEAHPWLITMCGLPFAGKSTLAVAIGQSLGVPTVSIDAINTARGIGLNGAPITPQQWEETYAEAYRQTDLLLSARTSLLFDHASVTRAERDMLRGIAARHGAATSVIYLPIAPEDARARLHANRTTHARHDVRDDLFDLALRSFEPPDGEADVIRYDATMPVMEWIRETFAASLSRLSNE